MLKDTNGRQRVMFRQRGIQCSDRISLRLKMKLLKNHFWFIHLSDQPYCVEITPLSKKGDAISILKNNKVVDTTPRLNDFKVAHRTCFDLFLPNRDIIELRNGGKDGGRISVKLINNGISTQLLFGQNADLTSVFIDGNNNKCRKKKEITPAIKIHDGKIIESECLGSFTY